MSIETLPQCELIEVLKAKAASRHNIHFEFLARLRDLRDRVTPEVSQINRLFPEYTPHDEQDHLRRLFSVAGIVLGRALIEQLNSAELFVLAASLYAHDWGMAVGEPEKQWILEGTLPPGASLDDFASLPDERSRLKKFAKEQRLAPNEQGFLGEIPPETWREYVRQTHAFRSGERARRFFEKVDGGVAEAIARVCEGHWLDFPQLQDFGRYPDHSSVLSEDVNVRALAVYLRLVDLLDLSEDRTPYVLWKFVAPRNARSSMEWAKHRALRSVISVPYQKGRVLHVDGGTDDPEVYAALEDLQGWCDEQFRGCSDLLRRMNEPRHGLDVYHIEWNLDPRGFRPLSIQFEFDRGAMFEILSNEIYKGDPYVFLRELLQNSIDAIRMRREILQLKEIPAGDLGLIRVDVEHGAEGDAVVTWMDDGVGMDESVVRNYLAVAGRSYYRSEDFEREGLKMDPISRFGVGILSCFMVADGIEIETCTEPHFKSPAKALRIEIPAVERRFRIREGAESESVIGTRVRVFVRGKKLPGWLKQARESRLRMTEYLCWLAGFVEFPIVVTENGKKTVILHPKRDPQAFSKRFGEDVSIHQLSLSFPWEKAIEAENLSRAREILCEKVYDVECDLGAPQMEGVLVYPFPFSPDVEVSKDNRSVARREGTSLSQNQRSATAQVKIHWNRDYLTEPHRGSSRSPATKIFRDGIVLADERRPFAFTTLPGSVIENPCLLVNLRSSRANQVDLGRTQVISGAPWHAALRSAFVEHLSSKHRAELLALPSGERFIQLGRLTSHRELTTDEVLSFFPREDVPIALMEAGGLLRFLEWRHLQTSSFHGPPYLPKAEVSCDLSIFSSVTGMWPSAEIWKFWSGETFVVKEFRDESDAVDRASEIARRVVEGSHFPAVVRFVTSPLRDDVALLQEEWRPRSGRSIDRKELQAMTAQAPEALSIEELRLLDPALDLPKIREFSAPFETAFSYGWEVLNARHPAALTLAKLAALAEGADLRPEQLGRLQYALGPLNKYGIGIESPDDLAAALHSLAETASSLGLLASVEELSVAGDEVVPGSFEVGNLKIRKVRFGLPFRPAAAKSVAPG